MTATTAAGALKGGWRGALVGAVAGLAVSEVVDAVGADSALARVANGMAGMATSQEFTGAMDPLVTDSLTANWESSSFPAVRQIAGTATGGAAAGAIGGGLRGGLAGGLRGAIGGGLTGARVGGLNGAVVGAATFGSYAAVWNETFSRCMKP